MREASTNYPNNRIQPTKFAPRTDVCCVLAFTFLFDDYATFGFVCIGQNESENENEDECVYLAQDVEHGCARRSDSIPRHVSRTRRSGDNWVRLGR